MKPEKILFFVICVIILLAFATWVTPSEGLKVGQFAFHMPAFSEMFMENETDFTNVSEIIEGQFSIDSHLEIDRDSTTHIIHKANYDSLIQELVKIELFS